MCVFFVRWGERFLRRLEDAKGGGLEGWLAFPRLVFGGKAWIVYVFVCVWKWMKVRIEEIEGANRFLCSDAVMYINVSTKSAGA